MNWLLVRSANACYLVPQNLALLFSLAGMILVLGDHELPRDIYSRTSLYSPTICTLPFHGAEY